MVTIYALINPFNNEPFYVGGTNQNLNTRLSQHLQCGYGGGIKEKKDLINQIKVAGLKVEIMPLLVCTNKAAGKCEKNIYQLLIKHGYTLLQLDGRIIRHKYQ